MKKYGCVPLVGTCTTNNVSLGSLLQRQPTADVEEVKHARWINIASIGNKRCFGQCSFCGTRHEAQNASELKLFHRRCHWCGALMDGGKKDV